jgi:hypothetical protein
MKKVSSKSVQGDEMREEYEFEGAVRGKHYKAMHDGYTVQIHQADGTTQVRNYALTNGTVFLHPDVRKYFPDSDAVNTALRSLIALMEAIPHRVVDNKEEPVRRGRS